MEYEIRKYHITDLSSLYKICLLTANNGSDASLLLADSDLVGHLYAAPYAYFEPNLCFILLKNAMPCGYILGTQNSIKFQERCEKEWFPELRKRYPLLDENDCSLQASFIRNLHQKHVFINEINDFIAHLHIDILPTGQGKGFGRQLIQNFLDQLQVYGVKGVHLIVSKENVSAIGFYKHIGFRELRKIGESIAFVKEV
tara:strand:+ start:107 stop:703 length:597 start_codon:yes stop_codon:yes gene_type:complete